MTTSPGERGGQTVLETGIQSFSRMWAKELISFSLQSFYDNFKEGKIVHEDLLAKLKEKVTKFENSVNQYI